MQTNRPGFHLTSFLPAFQLSQAQGRTSDGRPLYWRAEGGRWSLALGDADWKTDPMQWPEPVYSRYVAWGTYPLPKDEEDVPLIGVALASLPLALGDIDPRSLNGELAAGVTLDPSSEVH